MKKLLILLSAAATMTFYAPAPSHAQGFGIEVPGVGVRIGDQGRQRYRDRGQFREREVRGQYRERDMRSGGCRTVTIQRDDGTVKQIRRCD